MELEASFASRDLSAAANRTAEVERERDALQAQTQHWDDMRRTAEQVEALSRLIGSADSEELQELRRIRDQAKALEREHASLQKRCADQEAKIAAQQRTSAQTKQTMAVSQQKLSEWESKARAAEGDLAETRAQLEKAQQSQRQTDARVADLEHDSTAKAEAFKSSEVCAAYHSLRSTSTNLFVSFARIAKSDSETRSPLLNGNCRRPRATCERHLGQR